MSAPVHVRSAATPRADPLVLATIGALGIFTLVLVIAGNGDLGLALTPIALTLVILAVVRAPLRHSLLVLGVLCLTLENPSEVPAAGLWRSPVYIVGALLLAHMNLTLPVKSLFFSGLDVALVLLAGTWVVRRIVGSDVDMRGHIPVAPPLRATAVVCIAAILGVWGHGLVAEGADFRNSLWQIFRVIYLPIVFLLYCAGMRGPGDARRFGVALLVAALIRAALAIYVRHLYPSVDELPHATVHADSMLFADACALVLVVLFERFTPRSILLALFTLPILTWGMIANNRRLVWVELVAALIVLYCITPFTPIKRRIAQAVVILLPALAIYAAIGWSSPAAVFAPVRTLRSVVDSNTDSSTLWRDWENYNLYYTLRMHPVLGTGFGHGYTEVVKLPDISNAYELYRFAPHNSILGLLAYSGMFGFGAIWLVIPLGVFFAVRSYRFSRTPRERITALTTVAILVAYLVHLYGDMGLGTWASVFTVAPALALVGKQAVATGAWPLRARRAAALSAPRSG